MLVVIDHDDPTASQYTSEQALYRWLQVWPDESGMVAALNHAVRDLLKHPSLFGVLTPDVIGFIGDDHRFRTEGWDEVIAKTLEKSPGFVYGHDGFWQDGGIPTQIFISREIVEALGYFALPTCKHLYVDNAWKELGEATHCIRWLPEIMIEHMHPAAQKAEWDEGYKRVNSEEMYSRDRMAFEAWRNGVEFQRDVAKVKAVLDG